MSWLSAGISLAKSDERVKNATTMSALPRRVRLTRTLGSISHVSDAGECNSMSDDPPVTPSFVLRDAVEGVSTGESLALPARRSLVVWVRARSPPA